MSKFHAEAQVTVYPFSRQPEGSEVIIGRPDTGTFLSLPPEAVKILDHLATGKTVGEAQEHYFRQYGETPDLEDLLELLESRGLVWPAETLQQPVPEGDAAAKRYHFTSIPQRWAARLFSPLVLGIGALLVLSAVAAVVIVPDIVPGWSALYFETHRTLKSLSVILLSYVTLFIHEMGHLLAARATGVGSRLGISHRLWILVAETDLTGLWAIPRQKRYLPLLGGPIVDLVSASVVLLLLFAHAKGWLSPPTLALEFLRALFFIYLIQILWQLLFFVRTDFYYVFATFFGCKNLKRDTEDFLRNRLARFLPRLTATDQSHIPRSELQVVRVYSLFWLGGRLVALGMLVFISLPLFVRYLQAVAATLSAGFRNHPYAFLDSLMLAAFAVIPFSLGLGLWLRSLMQRWRPS